jgi:molecular chaperone GrpE
LAGNLLNNYIISENRIVIMKKKSKEQGENKHIKENKTTDNKDNSYKPENSNWKSSDMSSSDESTKFTSEQETDTDIITKEVRVVEEKLADIQDKYIRLSAEFDNYRKRTLREKMEMSKYAGEDLLLKILPLMDDFDRARSHMDTATDCAAMKNGIDLIYGKFSEFLKLNDVKEIDSLNCNFDVDLHEAVAKVPVEENDKKGKVIDVVLKGYYFQDKVLRFTKVVVGE